MSSGLEENFITNLHKIIIDSPYNSDKYILSVKIISLIIITAFTIFFGLLPLIWYNILFYKYSVGCRKSTRVLGLANAFSGGLFMGIALFHLLPESIENFNQYFTNSDNDSTWKKLPCTFFIAFVSYSMILFIEKIAFDSHSLTEHNHGDHHAVHHSHEDDLTVPLIDKKFNEKVNHGHNHDDEHDDDHAHAHAYADDHDHNHDHDQANTSLPENSHNNLTKLKENLNQSNQVAICPNDIEDSVEQRQRQYSKVSSTYNNLVTEPKRNSSENFQSTRKRYKTVPHRKKTGHLVKRKNTSNNQDLNANNIKHKGYEEEEDYFSLSSEDCDDYDFDEQTMKNVVSSKGKFASYLQARNIMNSPKTNFKYDKGLLTASKILEKSQALRHNSIDKDCITNLNYRDSKEINAINPLHLPTMGAIIEEGHDFPGDRVDESNHRELFQRKDNEVHIVVDETHHFHPKSNFTPYLLLIALSVHGLFEGTALGVQTSFKDALFLAAAILAHKWAEAFTLGISFFKSNTEQSTFIKMIVLFTIFTPIGILLGIIFISADPLTQGIFLAISSGTFIYISASEVIVEEFAITKYRYQKFSLYLCGGILVGLLAYMEVD